MNKLLSPPQRRPSRTPLCWRNSGSSGKSGARGLSGVQVTGTFKTVRRRLTRRQSWATIAADTCVLFLLIARPQWLVFGGVKETLFIFYSFIRHREGQAALFRNKISRRKKCELHSFSLFAVSTTCLWYKWSTKQTQKQLNKYHRFLHLKIDR